MMPRSPKQEAPSASPNHGSTGDEAMDKSKLPLLSRSPRCSACAAASSTPARCDTASTTARTSVCASCLACSGLRKLRASSLPSVLSSCACRSHRTNLSLLTLSLVHAMLLSQVAVPPALLARKPACLYKTVRSRLNQTQPGNELIFFSDKQIRQAVL